MSKEATPKEQPTEQPKPLVCTDCGSVLETYFDEQGKKTSPEKIAAASMAKYGRVMCTDCAIAAAVKGKQEGKNERVDAVMKDLIRFDNAAREACIESDKTYTFTCPICGGDAQVGKSSSNGHHHAKCSKCGMGMME